MNSASRSTQAWFAVVGIVIAGTGYYSATHLVDVPIYRDVGRQLLTGNYDIYSAEADGGFRYAPIVALLFVPLALMPAWLGASLIFALNVLALVATAAIVSALTGIDRARIGLVGGVSFLMAGGYVIEAFRTGNVHFLSLFLVVVAIYLVERGRTLWPSLLLALAIAIKLTPLLFVFYFALRKRIALCLLTMAVLVVMFALPALFVGVEGNNRLMGGFIESASHRLGESRNHSLRGALVRHLTDDRADAGEFPSVNVAELSTVAVMLLWLALSTCLVAALAAGIVWAPRDRWSTMLEYALLIPVMLLLSPHTLRMYFSTLFVPFCVLVCLLIAEPAHRCRRLIVATLGVSFVAGTLMPLLLPSRALALTYEALSPHVVVAALVCASLSVVRWGAQPSWRP